MEYSGDQCENCGGVRVAHSTLCADCLVKYSILTGGKVKKLEKQNKELKEENQKFELLVCKTLDHIIAGYGYAAGLRLYVADMIREVDLQK